MAVTVRAPRLAASSILPSLAEADGGGRGTGGSHALDGAGRGPSEPGAALGGKRGGEQPVLADIEVGGGRRQADAVPGAEALERDINERPRLAREHPERAAVGGQAHGNGRAAEARVAAGLKARGVDFADRAGFRNQGVNGMAAGGGEHRRRRAFERKLARQAKSGEVHGGNRAAARRGHEQVPRVAGSFAPAAGGGGRRISAARAARFSAFAHHFNVWRA